MFSHTFYQTNRKAFLPVGCYPEGIKLSFCTLCFCFPTKMLYLNAPFFSTKMFDNAYHVETFLLILTIKKRCKKNNVYKLMAFMHIHRAKDDTLTIFG